MTITQQKTEITQQSDDKTADIGIILRLANNSGRNSGTSTGPIKIWVLNPYNGPDQKSIAEFFSYIRISNHVALYRNLDTILIRSLYTNITFKLFPKLRINSFLLNSRINITNFILKTLSDRC